MATMIIAFSRYSKVLRTTCQRVKDLRAWFWAAMISSRWSAGFARFHASPAARSPSRKRRNQRPRVSRRSRLVRPARHWRCHWIERRQARHSSPRKAFWATMPSRSGIRTRHCFRIWRAAMKQSWISPLAACSWSIDQTAIAIGSARETARIFRRCNRLPKRRECKRSLHARSETKRATCSVPWPSRATLSCRNKIRRHWDSSSNSN